MKTENISIRVSEELKQKLERISEQTGQSHSQIIRPLLDENLIEPKVIELGDGRSYNTVTDHKLINNFEFTELIFWIYDKYREPSRDEIDEFYEHLLTVIEKVRQSCLFTSKFFEELDKIQKEIVSVLQDKSIYQFTFPKTGGFDYFELFIAIHMIRFNSNNEQFISF